MYWEPDRECMEREELEQLQFERLQSTLNRIYSHVPFYRKRFDALGILPEDIGSLADFSRLPFTAKEDLRESYPYGLFAVPLREVVRIHASSGTTGASTVVGYTRNDIRIWSNLTARVPTVAGGSAESPCAALPEIRPVRGGALVRADAPGDPGEASDRRHGQLRPVRNHRPRRLGGVPGAERPPHQRGPLPGGGGRPGDPETDARRGDGRARDHLAHQGGLPDDPVPDAGPDEHPFRALPLRAHAAPDGPGQGADRRHADHQGGERLPLPDRVRPLRNRGDGTALPDRDRPEGGSRRGNRPGRGRRDHLFRSHAATEGYDGTYPEAPRPGARDQRGGEAS